MIELPLLRVRSFAIANAATMVFFAGFAAMLLAGVLLLTQVWGYSVLTAGFALMPGPAMAALFARYLAEALVAGRPAADRGARRPGDRGELRWLLPQVGAEPDYVRLLPAPGSCSAGWASASSSRPCRRW